MSRSARSLIASAAVAAFALQACFDELAPTDPTSAASRIAQPSASARQSGPPGSTGTDATPMFSDQVYVSWIDKSNETGFRVERSIDSVAWVSAAVLPANSIGLVDEGRTSEQRVCYRVVALFAKRESAPFAADCTTPPAAPTELAAVVVDSRTVDLTWKDNSSVEDGFDLTRWTDSIPETLIAESPPNATSYRDTGFQGAVKHSYSIRPKKDGGFGSRSNVVTAGGPPPPPPLSAPSALTAVATGQIIYLTWTDNATGEEGFRIERSSTEAGPWTPLQTIYPANASTSSDAVLAEQMPCYRVSAFNKDVTSVPSNTDCAARLFEPSGLSATQVDGTTIDVTWTNRSTLADGVEVRRAPSSDGPFVVIVSVAPTASSYRDAGLAPNTTYWYRVLARRQDDVSTAYGLASAVTAATTPDAPSNLDVLVTSSTALSLTWTDNSQNENGFRIERSFDGGSTWGLDGTTLADDWYWGYGPATPDQNVCFRVRAINGIGESAPSNVVCTTPPAAATDLTADLADGLPALAWRDNSSVEDGYRIYRSTAWSTGVIDEDMVVIAVVGPNVTTFRDNVEITTPCEGTVYYRVQPIKGSGAGDWSNMTSVNYCGTAAQTTAPRK